MPMSVSSTTHRDTVNALCGWALRLLTRVCWFL